VHSCATDQSEKMIEPWIRGCVVQRIMFRDGLVLNLDEYNELVISVPFHLTLPETARNDEEVVLIDPKAVLFLLGTEMDYKADKMQAQFIFNNPNQVSACGCGESVQLTAAKVD